MEEGFYLYRNLIYYGRYHAEQVANQWSVSQTAAEELRTDHPIGVGDCAVRLWDNHSILEVEYENLQNMLGTMGGFLTLTGGEAIDCSAVEERLNIVFPRELKQIYTAIHGQTEYFSAVEHFLPLDELYVEQGILVFFKKKRSPIAGYDLKGGQLARYSKKEWHIERSDMCCYQFCVGRILTIALEHKPVVKKGRCRGEFVTTLNIEQELERFCNEKYHLLLDFNVYGIAVMYSEDGLIAWIRSNGLYGDVHAGAEDEGQLEDFREHLGSIAWKETGAT